MRVADYPREKPGVIIVPRIRSLQGGRRATRSERAAGQTSIIAEWPRLHALVRRLHEDGAHEAALQQLRCLEHYMQQAGHAVPRVLRPESEATDDEVEPAPGLDEMVDLVAQVRGCGAGGRGGGGSGGHRHRTGDHAVPPHRVRAMCVG
jgi:hypothetical protein